jgi:predicted PurR-regulated permease PerM
MSKSWLKFFTLFYGFVELLFHLSQIVIGRLVYLLIKPSSVFSIIFFIIVLIIACVLYYITVKFLIKQIRIHFKSLDKFLTKIENYDEEFQRKNKSY